MLLHAQVYLHVKGIVWDWRKEEREGEGGKMREQGGQRIILTAISQMLSILCLETGSLTGLELTKG